MYARIVLNSFQMTSFISMFLEGCISMGYEGCSMFLWQFLSAGLQGVTCQMKLILKYVAVNSVHSSHTFNVSQVNGLGNWDINGGMLAMKCGGTVGRKQRILRDGYALWDLSSQQQQHRWRFKSFVMWHRPTGSWKCGHQSPQYGRNYSPTRQMSHLRRL